MFDTICTLPLQSDLFAQVIHPTEPLFAVGLSSGHVQAYKLPSDTDLVDDGSEDSHESAGSGNITNGNGSVPVSSSLRRGSSASASESGLGSVSTIWSTKRHKGSCRCLAFSHDGQICYSAGTDGLVKSFMTESGKVVGKIAIPQSKGGPAADAPTVLHALSPQTLLLATDAGKLYLHDLRQDGKEVTSTASQTWAPHGDEHINALVPLPASETSTSGFPKQWVSVGGTTLAVTDLRKGTIATSEDQEIELTSVTLLQGLKKGGTSVGEKILVGQGDGVMSLWEKGVWDDLDDRVVLDRGGLSIESLAEVPLGYGRGKLKMNEKLVAAGLEDGRVRFLRIGRNGVLNDMDAKHDEIDGVVALGFDIEGRMISGGGQIVKVWTEAKGLPGGGRANHKHDMSSDDDDDEDDEDSEMEASSDEEGKAKSKRKKRKRNKGKDKAGGKALDFSM
ncbi:WD40-repeat-containing domain protein [Exophiala viscosa]|uniref:WD40-repeat-containing domain protein n=1 Tax=Exophiala viscosa TaxID=2486360 RepID=UPI0021926B08|nr:WD40-repeat-containing domain protein [Exophiala viscosa]